MKKRLTSFISVLALSFSLFSVSASAEFTNTDSRTLTDIYKVIQYLNLSPGSWQRNSVIGFLERILNAIPSNLSTNFALQGGEGTNSLLNSNLKYLQNLYNYVSGSNITGNLGEIQRNTLATADRVLGISSKVSTVDTHIQGGNSILESINTAVGGINGFATESTLSAFVSYFDDSFGTGLSGNWSLPYELSFGDYSTHGNWTAFVDSLSRNLTFDGFFDSSAAPPTLYRMIKLLQETLASERDRQLAENNKENRDEVEKDFLGGQSGPTSLGKGDFSNASQVGGALNDTFNMGGAAKVSDFLSGFGSAGSESLAWFSQTTVNNLNAVDVVDGKSGVSTFADDGETMVDVDPDPYNMRNIFERYDWLEGVNMVD